jgi:acyl-CoA synthetase (AMP-forming)/AMP-acid ligase II
VTIPQPLPALLGGDRAPAPRTLVDILLATVEACPDDPAVDSGVETLTYAELADAAGELADRLGELGIGPGDKVGVRVRSGTADLYLGIVGILLAGAAYVPVEADDPDERALARAELAELVEGEDDLTADTLWEGVLAHARDTDDPDLMVEAIAHLAEIAEAHGDPLAAAEFQIEFLNWRRQPGHASDADAVLDAFDEVVRLARLDGDPKAAALYEFRQASFARLAEADDERAYQGDWERDPKPYESWS